MCRIKFCLFLPTYALAAVCLAFWVARPTLAQQRKFPLPPAQAFVDYNKPPREYETARLDGWTVHVEKSLQTDAPDLARQALTRLQAKLRAALDALPKSSRAGLKRLPLFLMYGPKAKEGGRDNGLEYFQKNAPTHDAALDPRWANGVVIYSAENYVRLSDLWALKALVHEFAHAYQLNRWPEDQPDILRAWQNAIKCGLYQDVKDDEGKNISKAYAAVNPLEYFAELSCIYFACCNYPPFNRAELKVYDPVGYAMIEKMWKPKS